MNNKKHMSLFTFATTPVSELIKQGVIKKQAKKQNIVKVQHNMKDIGTDYVPHYLGK